MQLTDLPRPLDPAVYEDTRNAIREKFLQISGVIEVLEFGMIPLPGISDMDFFVVVEPGKQMTFPGLKSYTTDQRYAMSHMQFLLSPQVFPHLRQFDPWLIHADPLLQRDPYYTMDSIEQISEEDRHALSLDYIFASWIAAGLLIVAEIKGTGTIACREFLEGAKGTEYCFREFKRAGITGDVVDPNAPLIQLRKDWFTIPEADLPRRLEEAVEGFQKSLGLLLGLLAKALGTRATEMPATGLEPKTDRQRKLLAEYPQSLILQTDRETFIFQKGATTTTLRYDTWKSVLSGKMYGHGTYVLPLETSATQNVFLQGEGPLSKQYASCCFTDLPTIPVYAHPAIRKRIDMMNRNFADTAHVIGGKPPTLTYGAISQAAKAQQHRGTLRARLGGMYDRWMQRVPRTALGKIVATKNIEIHL